MRIFVSYSWDSEPHKQWVQQLADDLRDMNPDFDLVYDQVGMDHRVDRNQYMEVGIFESDVVLLIVTRNYTEKANSRQGGVGRETAMAAERHWKEMERHGKTRIIGIKRGEDADLPRYLQASLYLDFSKNERYGDELRRLESELRAISAAPTEAAATPKAPISELKAVDPEVYTFTRTDELIAGFYKVRHELIRERDFSRDSARQRLSLIHI